MDKGLTGALLKHTDWLIGTMWDVAAVGTWGGGYTPQQFPLLFDGGTNEHQMTSYHCTKRNVHVLREEVQAHREEKLFRQEQTYSLIDFRVILHSYFVPSLSASFYPRIVLNEVYYYFHILI